MTFHSCRNANMAHSLEVQGTVHCLFSLNVILYRISNIEHCFCARGSDPVFLFRGQASVVSGLP